MAIFQQSENTTTNRQENFNLILQAVCDRCGKEKTRERSRLAGLHRLTWVHYPHGDICPKCLEGAEIDAANRHLKNEAQKYENMMKNMDIKINYLTREIENCKIRKEKILAFQDDWNKSRERRLS